MRNKKHLNFDLYKRALSNNETMRCTQQRFKSDHHKIYTQNVRKITQTIEMIKEYNHLMGLLHTQ